MQYFDQIRKIRKETLKVDQEVAALMCNMKREQFINIENGKGNPTIKTLQKIADSFGVELGKLLVGEPNTNIIGNNNNQYSNNSEKFEVHNSDMLVTKLFESMKSENEVLKDEVKVLKYCVENLEEQIKLLTDSHKPNK